VPKSKATVLRGGSRLVDDKTRKILKDAGTVIINQPHKRYLCVSCSVHRGVTPQRREEKRR
jgi:ribosomal protein S26